MWKDLLWDLGGDRDSRFRPRFWNRSWVRIFLRPWAPPARVFPNLGGSLARTAFYQRNSSSCAIKVIAGIPANRRAGMTAIVSFPMRDTCVQNRDRREGCSYRGRGEPSWGL